MSREGFTLIELMLVVVIIGILAAIAVPNMVSLQARAKEASIKSNCHTVQLTAEDFGVMSGGLYPNDVDSDTTPGGDTMIDMLPDGQRMINPFTKNNTEPINGAAVGSGQVGYVPVLDNGVPNGYVITGFGIESNVITITGGQ